MNLFDRAINTAEGLLQKAEDSIFRFVHNRSTFTDVRNIHGFYRQETPQGRLLGYRFHCPVSGDWPVASVKGAAVIHCPERKRETLDPDAAMPAVIQYPARRGGMAILPDGSRVVDASLGEFGGEFGYEQSDYSRR